MASRRGRQGGGSSGSRSGSSMDIRNLAAGNAEEEERDWRLHQPPIGQSTEGEGDVRPTREEDEVAGSAYEMYAQRYRHPYDDRRASPEGTDPGGSTARGSRIGPDTARRPMVSDEGTVGPASASTWERTSRGLGSALPPPPLAIPSRPLPPPLPPPPLSASPYLRPPIAQGGMPAPPRLTAAMPSPGAPSSQTSARRQAATVGTSGDAEDPGDRMIGDTGRDSRRAAVPPGSGAMVQHSLEGTSRISNGRRYRLVVVQHPVRARMCGFGDKDRRPLNPTLIAKVVVSDAETDQEIPAWEVNTSLFLLSSDLCHADDLMATPRNILVHQHATAVPTSAVRGANAGIGVGGVPLSGDRQQASGPSSEAGPSSRVAASGLTAARRSSTDMRSSTSISIMDPGSQHQPQQMMTFATSPVPSGRAAPQPPAPSLTTITTESYTRNLVGASVASANVLRDEDDVPTIFFVLQDLSVRTEGVYRIKLTFFDLSNGRGEAQEGTSQALAEAYTDPFTVYSPRKFPGVMEPTELSKKLASQGTKINTRGSDRKRRRGAGAGGDSPEGDETRGDVEVEGGAGEEDDEEGYED